MSSSLFSSVALGDIALANRIVMAPMTRSRSPSQIPGDDVAAYYRRRAVGGVGLIITEGTYIKHPSAGDTPGVPYFWGDEAAARRRRLSLAQAAPTAAGAEKTASA